MLDRARFLIITEVAEVTSRGATSVEGSSTRRSPVHRRTQPQHREGEAAKAPVKVTTVKFAVAKRAKAS